MCNECLSTASTAARSAQSRLKVAVDYLDSERGRGSRSAFYPEVSAAMNAQTGVLIRQRPEVGARALPADLHDLRKAEEAFTLMALTDAGQVKPYFDFSRDREEVSSAIAAIERIWADDPDGHPNR